MKQMLAMFLSLLSLTSCSKNEEIFDSAAEETTSEITNRRLQMMVGSSVFAVSLDDSPAARKFISLLPLTLKMNEMNGNEKYGNLPTALPSSPSNPGTIRCGDLMLFGSNTLVLFYKTFSPSYPYTRIGHINAPEEVEVALGEGNITVKFEPLTK